VKRGPGLGCSYFIMTHFRRCSHAYPACVAARLAGELYGEYEMCPKEAAENEPHIRDELAEDAARRGRS